MERGSWELIQSSQYPGAHLPQCGSASLKVKVGGPRVVCEQGTPGDDFLSSASLCHRNTLPPQAHSSSF